MVNEKGVIAAGHPETVKSAELILKKGGNAFDAVIAAQFTAFVTEPVLTSLGGGGFMMAQTTGSKPTLYDFFVQTPGQKKNPDDLKFHPISADFGEVQQEYHIGPGSAAIPGMVKGLFEVHNDLCSLPMKVLVERAVELARNGVIMNSFQSGVFDIIRPIYRTSEGANRIFKSLEQEGDLIREGERLKQPELADTIEDLARYGAAYFYKGEIATIISEICSEQGGHLTAADLKRYSVVKRRPARFMYRGHEVFINPPPASGGILIAFALKLLESVVKKIPVRGSLEYIDLLAQIQHMTNKARMDAFLDDPSSDPVGYLLDPEYLDQYKKMVRDRAAFYRGTTQISIADGEGNLASLTSSNGEGSGVMIPGTGIMLNNMLGEQDLNPGGFHQWTPDQRVSSMMAPGILNMPDGTNVVFGSGGSNRIRTAILQFLINLVDYEMALDESVNAPRLHFESGQLNAEKGFNLEHFQALEQQYTNQKIWKKKALFFGGVHAVSIGPKGFSGAGDVRRGGVSVIC
ncbi:gamma-glutamyltransferase [Rhodohalobacter sp. 8-1]|uniref:gamma-glutamyltransferase n=1 Tax=Rhodohalobacter sp. 8-1 TaxID=3131972 RepID=UPI0030EBDE9F